MRVAELIERIDLADAGRRMHALVAELYPLCRSITGDGVRATLRAIGREVPLEVHEVPSGTPVFDWTVPKEWNVREAWIRGPRGETVVDFARSNLHLVSYSAPVRARMLLAELRPHLHSLPEEPGLVPYRTSYYKESWGFCLAHRDLERLPDGEYEVRIDATLEPGALTYGECFLPGALDEEVLLSAHVCHPSLCNDNLSGVALATEIAHALAGLELRRSYRVLFAPATIGSIAWLARNEAGAAARVRAGLVLACVGDAGQVTYKRSRRGDAEIDRAVAHVLARSGAPHEILDFSPYGYDERQFCSPGFDLPVGCLMRTPHGRFEEYHTSADDLDFIGPAHLADSLATTLSAIAVLEGNETFASKNPRCEPQLGRRGLYRELGGLVDAESGEMAMLWVLNLADGRSSLLDVAERARLPFAEVRRAADLLLRHGLLEALP